MLASVTVIFMGIIETLMERTALITGASRGIGRAIATRLAKAGFGIRAHGRNEQALDETCRLVCDAGGQAEPFVADLTDTAAIERLAEWATADGLDVVVHNAGIGGHSRVVDADFKQWDQILDVDLRAPMRLTALTLPHVTERQGAYIFIGSISATMGMAGSGAYCAAKHGLDGFASSAIYRRSASKGCAWCEYTLGTSTRTWSAGQGWTPTR